MKKFKGPKKQRGSVMSISAGTTMNITKPVTPPGGAPNATAFVVSEDVPSPGGAGTFRLDAFWKPDGTRCFTCRGLNFEVAQNDVSPAWGIQPGNWTNFVTTANFSNIRSIWWSPDGTKLSVCTRVPSAAFNIKVHDQSATPFDLTVLGASTNKTIGVQSGGPSDHIWSADGKTLWQVYDGTLRQIIRFTALVSFDPTTLGAAVDNFDMLPDIGTDGRTFAFSTDGTVMYGMDGQVLVSWDLSIPFDITTMANFQTGPSIPAALGSPRGLTVRPDNTDIFVTGDQNQRRAAWFRIP